MAHQRNRRADSGLGLNLTPMIDVVFILIIFFMVTSDLMRTDLEYMVCPDPILVLANSVARKSGASSTWIPPSRPRGSGEGSSAGISLPSW